MRLRRFLIPSAVTLIAALAIAVQIAARDQSTYFRHYKLIDMGTFGGPASFINAPFNDYPMLNDHGTTVGSSATSIPTTSTSNFFVCGGGDGIVPNIFHAFKSQNGGAIDLGALPPENENCSNAVSINAAGQIVGLSEISEIDLLFGVKKLRGVLWRGGRMIDLGTMGGSFTVPTAINNRGQVVGGATNTTPDPFGFGTQTRAFLWERGVMQDLGTLGGPDSFAEFVNERGQVEGFSFINASVNPATGLPTGHPFLWTNGEMQDLGSLGGTLAGFGGDNQQGALNNRGQVIGISTIAGDRDVHPFLWDGRRLIDLNTETSGGNPESANALNDAGDIVGTAAFAGRPFSDAYLWRRGRARDLGAVGDDCFSEAWAINSRDQIIGISYSCTSNVLRTFLWESGSMVDLNSLSFPHSLQLIDGDAINDRGEIAGVGVPPGCSDFTDAACGHAYLLIPICADGTEGCSDAPLDPALVTRIRASTTDVLKAMTSMEVVNFKARIDAMRASMKHRNRRFPLRQRK